MCDEHVDGATLEARLAGRVAVVTGAGSGIGRATALRLHALGASVVGMDLSLGGSGEASLRRDDRMELVEADVTDEADAARTVNAAAVRFGGVDALVNVAGIFGANPPIADVDSDTVWRTFAVNVIGPTLMLKHAVPFIRARRGTVVNVTSMVAERPTATGAYYAASKAAFEHLTRCWALELAGDGVRVNAVAPGPTNTPVLRRSGLSDQEISEMRSHDAARTPLARSAEPDDIARWIVRFTDPESHATGQTITVDGGLGLT